jgi:coenzyme F420-reducing hydrogenase alpha subunit
MAQNANIHVHHLTRVEGHGDITARIANGELEEVRFDIVEAPRCFEAFLRGRDYDEVVHIAPRICGICSVSHACAALKATEEALGVEVSEQTELLRRLAFHGEILSSHILHVYFLAGPDFFGTPSIFPLAESDPETVKRAMRLKNLGYDLSKVVVGRHTHPVAMQVGGFTFVHPEKDLEGLKERLSQGREEMEATVDLFKGFRLPGLQRETEYVSLSHPDRYAFYDGDVVSSDGPRISPADYREAVKEYVVSRSTAKYARWNRPEYMVGALARFNNNHEQLTPGARDAARKLGLEPPCTNPFEVTWAQIVESMHCVEESLQLVDELLNRGIRAEDETRPVEPRAGSGVGAVEAPRGILFHEYAYDAGGKCTFINQIIPTNQNLANLEADMRDFVPRILDRAEEDIRHGLEMLVRAYDPCISCSTHMVRVKLTAEDLAQAEHLL